VLSSPADRSRCWDATAPAGPPDSWLTGMMRAPLLVVPHASRDAYLDRYAEPDKGWTDRDEARWPVPYWYVDAGFASLLMLLGAVDAGLGACFFGIPPEATATYREAFGVHDADTPTRAVRLDQLTTTKRELALDRLLAEDSTFYGDLFPHVVQWEGGLYLEDGLHRALRAALQQRTSIHARVLALPR